MEGDSRMKRTEMGKQDTVSWEFRLGLQQTNSRRAQESQQRIDRSG